VDPHHVSKAWRALGRMHPDRALWERCDALLNTGGVLTADTTGSSSSHSGIDTHENPVSSTTHLRCHHVDRCCGQSLPHTGDVPGRRGQELLQLLVIHDVLHKAQANHDETRWTVVC